MTKKKIYIRDGRAPIPKDERVSRTMSAIRAKNTKPELLVRNLLSKALMRGYRLHQKNIAGRPDVVFPKKKVAIFVHGCFWHGCPYCKLKLPKTHGAFWRNKIGTNKLRDGRKNKELRRLGWKVTTIWACRLKTDRGQKTAVGKIRDAVNSAR